MIEDVVMMPVLIIPLLKTEIALTAEQIIVKIGLPQVVVAPMFKKPELVTTKAAMLVLVLIPPILKQEMVLIVGLIIAKIGLCADVTGIT